MQIFKVHAVLLSRRLSQVANSRSRDSDLFYALADQSEAIIAERRIEKKRKKERQSAAGSAHESNFGRRTGDLRDPVAFFMVVPRPSRHWSLVGAVLEDPFFCAKI